MLPDPIVSTLAMCPSGERSTCGLAPSAGFCNRCPLTLAAPLPGRLRPTKQAPNMMWMSARMFLSSTGRAWLMHCACVRRGKPYLTAGTRASSAPGTSVAPASSLPTAPAPAADCVLIGPPDIPLRPARYSCVYVPLLLDAADILAPQARNAWHTHPAFAPWCSGTVRALLARPLLSVHHVADVARAVAIASPEHAASLAGLFTARPMPFLAALIRQVSRGGKSFYITGPGVRGPTGMRHTGHPGATHSLLFATARLRSRSASCRHCSPPRPSRLWHCEPPSMHWFTYVHKALKSRPGKPLRGRR